MLKVSGIHKVLLGQELTIAGFETAPVSYGTDVPRFKGNHKKYLYGPGSILVAHGEKEQIELSELLEGVQQYKKLTLHLLKGDT